MMLFKNKEHLLYYMLQGHVHLSKKDFGFYNNLQYIVKNSNKVTSNQDKLFDKLTTKYQRQLKKLGHDINELQTLKWNVELQESLQEFLQAQVTIVDNSIQIRSPFNTSFIQSLRNVADNTFLWHKDKKLYVSEFSTNALYIAVNLVQKHFKDHVFSDEINDILEGLSVYENMTWNPTLKKVDGRFYIVALNQSLYDAIADIELNDDPKTLMLLSNHGVIISDEVFDNDPFKIFAGNYFVEVDLASLAQVSEWMKLLEVDHVFTANHMIYTKQITNDIKVHLLTDGITVSPAGSTDHKNGVLFKTTHTVPLRVNMKKISKIVHLVNSTPVGIR